MGNKGYMDQYAHSQYPQNIYLYRDIKKAEIRNINLKIKAEKEFINEIEKILPTLIGKERTSKEFKGMVSIKQSHIYCNENLIKIIEKIPDCI